MFSWTGVQCLETNYRSVPGRSSATSWRCLQPLAILFCCCFTTLVNCKHQSHKEDTLSGVKDNCLLYNPAKSLIQQFSQTTILLWVIWKVSGSVSFQEQTIKTGCISTSHFKLQEALMSQGNNFLFIYLQMPSCTRIQPVHLLSQKPCGSSQPELDVTACSCPGWLLPRGQPQCEEILTLHFRKLEMLLVELDLLHTHQPFFKCPSLVPVKNRHCPHWTSGLALHDHSLLFFLVLFPFEAMPSLNSVLGHRSQQDTLHHVYLGIRKPPPKSWPAQTHCSPTSAPSPCAWQSVSISSCDNSIGTRSWAAHLLQTKQLQLRQSPIE